MLLVVRMAKTKEFRLIIASSATFTTEYPTYLSITHVEQTVARQKKRMPASTQLALVSGTHMGIEPQAALLADRLDLPYYRFTQPSIRPMIAADYACNERMAAFSHGVLALWDGEDSLVKHLMGAAHYHKLQIVNPEG